MTIESRTQWHQPGPTAAAGGEPGIEISLTADADVANGARIPFNTLERGAATPPSIVLPETIDWILGASAMARLIAPSAIALGQITVDGTPAVLAARVVAAQVDEGVAAAVCGDDYVTVFRDVLDPRTDALNDIDRGCGPWTANATPPLPPGPVCVIAGFLNLGGGSLAIGSHTFALSAGSVTIDGSEVGTIIARLQSVWIRAELLDTELNVKAWYEDESEPGSWTGSATGLTGEITGIPTVVSVGSGLHAIAIGIAPFTDMPAPARDDSHSWDVNYHWPLGPYAGDHALGGPSNGQSEFISVDGGGGDDFFAEIYWTWPTYSPPSGAVQAREERRYNGYAVPAGVTSARLQATVNIDNGFQGAPEVGDDGDVNWAIVNAPTYAGGDPPPFDDGAEIASGSVSVLGHHGNGGGSSGTDSVDETFDVEGDDWMVLAGKVDMSSAANFGTGSPTIFQGFYDRFQITLSDIVLTMTTDADSLAAVACGSTDDLPGLIFVPAAARLACVKRYALPATAVIEYALSNTAGAPMRAVAGATLSTDPAPLTIG